MIQGERVFVFSDGLPELAIPGGRQLGLRRIAELLQQTRKLDIQMASRHVVNALDSARQDVAQEDDVTFAIVDMR